MSTYDQFKYAPVVFTPQQAQLDPVGKIRISQPENLIDTDFEYGLQATKWETLELVNNIPFAFARQGEAPIDISSVTIQADSDIVRVITEVEHNFVPGIPFRLSGLRTIAISSEGVSIVTRVINSTAFEYKARKINEITTDVTTDNSELVPGAFYSSSHYKLNELNRIYTDGGSPTSNVVIEFPSPHGFIVNTAFYIVNSVTARSIGFDAEEYTVSKGSGVVIPTTANVDFNVANGVAVIPDPQSVNERDTIQPYVWAPNANGTIRMNANNFDVSTDVFEFDTAHDFGNNTPVILMPPIDWLNEVYPLGANATYGSTAAAAGNWITTNGRFFTMKFVRPINATAFRLYPNTTATEAQYTNFTLTPSDYGNNFCISPCWPISAVNITTEAVTIDTARLPKYANDSARPYPAQNTRVVVVASGYGINATAWTQTVNRHTSGITQYSYQPLLIGSTGAGTSTPTLTFENGTLVNIRNTTISANGRRDNSFTALLEAEPIAHYHSFHYTSHGLSNGDIVTPRIQSANTLALTSPGTTTYANSFINDTPYFVQTIDDDRFRLTTNTGVVIQIFRQPKDINIAFNSVRLNPLRDRFVLNNHGFAEGTLLTYSSNGQTAVGGLTGSTFYVHRPTTNTFLLSTTEDGYSSNPYTKTFTLTTTTCDLVNDRFVTTHDFGNGDLIQVTGDDLPVPLANGEYYRVGNTTGTANFRLFYNASDAATPTNHIQYLDTGTGSITMRRSDVVDITSAGVGTQKFSVTAVGAADGVYNITSIPNTNTVLIETTSQFDPKIYQVDAANVIIGEQHSITFANHQLVTGLPLSYTLESGAVLNTDYELTVCFANTFTGANCDIANDGITETLSATPVKLFPQTTSDLLDTGVSAGVVYYASEAAGVITLYKDARANVAVAFNGDGTGNTVVYRNLNGKYKFDGTVDTLTQELGDSTTYVVVGGKNTFRLAKTQQAAFEYNFLPISNGQLHYANVHGTGHTFTSNSVAGEVVGLGYVDIINDSNTIVGSQTTFSSYFREGDPFRTYIAGAVIDGGTYTTNSTNIVVASDIIRITGGVNNSGPAAPGIAWPDVGFETVWRPQRGYFTTTGTSPGGLEANKLYYYKRFDSADTRAFVYHNYLDAYYDINRIDITSSGTGVFNWFTVLDEFALNNVVDKVTGPFKIQFTNSVDITNTSIMPYGFNSALVDVQANNLSNQEYGITTSFIARTEGLVLHRPHDGGVEMLPALSPDARLTRQTRRYFRYQSGKGFQMSMAVNFNAPTEIDSFILTGYNLYDITIEDAGTGYTNGEFIKLQVPDRSYPANGYFTKADRSIHVKLNANGFIQTDANGAITKIAISNTGCDYWTANTRLLIVDENGANSSGVNANLTPKMVRGSATILARTPHRLSQGLTITTIDSDLSDGNTDYWNTQTEVFHTKSDAAQEDTFYTNVKGEGAIVDDIMIVAPGTGYSNSDIIVFSNANTTANGYTAVATPVTDVNGVITGFNISNTGYGYLQRPTLTIANSIGGVANGTGGDIFAAMRYSNAIPAATSATGFSQFYVRNWSNSRLRAGMFDDQNGLFYEFDGQKLYAVRRSSVKQLSGSANVQYNSTLIQGNGTQFTSQLVEKDFIVIRGASYVVTSILSDSTMHVQPPYRGTNAQEVTVSKTVDTRVPQEEWSIDPCVGTGATGYNLDINRIQMVYIDYAWYGAGKARFGFKDQNGEVIYSHEFIHNNFQTESYFRSGNLPARYEVYNIAQPDYVPALMHWGTSVIMDGMFQSDEAYLFTAAGDTLTYTGAGTVVTTGRIETTSPIQYTNFGRYLRETDTSLYNSIRSFWYVRGDSYTAVDTEVRGGTLITGNGISSNTFTVIAPFTWYQDETQAAIIINKQPRFTTAANTSYSFGSANSSLLVGKTIPLVSMRLGPSVDNSNIGQFGAREVINRMQLKLKSVGMVSTHDAEVKLILNGGLDNSNWERLEGTPSLSQYIKHTLADSISGGVPIFTFQVPGGALSGSVKTSNFFTSSIEDILSLGNSILGGNEVFPNGPDILTIAAEVQDFSSISATSPLKMQARITWSESQA